MKKLRNSISRHLNNCRGWRTDRHIVVIESDDWGSTCMPSKKAWESLLDKGIRVDKCPYATYDSLATTDDLTELFSLLSGIKDANGRPAVITANTIMANPDFERIRESGFRRYFYETFDVSIQKYYSRREPVELWKEGIDNGVFIPQFHGREHINVGEWLRQLNKPNSAYRKAFEKSVCWLGPGYNPKKGINLRATYDANDASEINTHVKGIEEGLRLFKTYFKKESESFIPPNFIYHSDLYGILKENGVQTLQGMKYLVMPKLSGETHELKRRIQGEVNTIGQVNLVRNCEFEPSQYPESYNSVGECLKGVSNAFFWSKPAVISAHRLNFIGNIHPENRTRNIKKFKELLNRITKKWPDVEFMTSVELGRLMSGKLDV